MSKYLREIEITEFCGVIYVAADELRETDCG
jgi:hypothetical protein